MGFIPIRSTADPSTTVLSDPPPWSDPNIVLGSPDDPFTALVHVGHWNRETPGVPAGKVFAYCYKLPIGRWAPTYTAGPQVRLTEHQISWTSEFNFPDEPNVPGHRRHAIVRRWLEGREKRGYDGETGKRREGMPPQREDREWRRAFKPMPEPLEVGRRRVTNALVKVSMVRRVTADPEDMQWDLTFYVRGVPTSRKKVMEVVEFFPRYVRGMGGESEDEDDGESGDEGILFGRIWRDYWAQNKAGSDKEEEKEEVNEGQHQQEQGDSGIVSAKSLGIDGGIEPKDAKGKGKDKVVETSTAAQKDMDINPAAHQESSATTNTFVGPLTFLDTLYAEPQRITRYLDEQHQAQERKAMNRGKEAVEWYKAKGLSDTDEIDIATPAHSGMGTSSTPENYTVLECRGEGNRSTVSIADQGTHTGSAGYEQEPHTHKDLTVLGMGVREVPASNEGDDLARYTITLNFSNAGPNIDDTQNASNLDNQSPTGAEDTPGHSTWAKFNGPFDRTKTRAKQVAESECHPPREANTESITASSTNAATQDEQSRKRKATAKGPSREGEAVVRKKVKFVEVSDSEEEFSVIESPGVIDWVMDNMQDVSEVRLSVQGRLKAKD